LYSHCTSIVLPFYSHCTSMYSHPTPTVLPFYSHVLPLYSHSTPTYSQTTPTVLPFYSHVLPLYFKNFWSRWSLAFSPLQNVDNSVRHPHPQVMLYVTIMTSIIHLHT
jgi:hypothetical protein